MAKKKLSSVVGIDIGSQSIKVAEIKNTGREIVVNAIGTAPTPDNMVDHNGVYDSDTIGLVVKELCAKEGVSVKDAVISISGQASILVRTLEVPRMTDGELKQHMEWEISRNQPFAESTVVSDYKAFPVTDPAAQNMDVVMAIGAQSAIDTIMGIGKKANKQVFAIDVQPLALGRSVLQSYGSDVAGHAVCIVDIGHRSTAINVYRDGQLLMPRQVPSGSEAWTQAIAGAMNLSPEEAERVKIERGEIPAEAGAVAAAPANPFGMDNPFATAQTQDFAPYNPFADDAAPAAPDVANPFAEDSGGYAAPADAYATPADPYSTPADAFSAPADPYTAPADPFAVPADTNPYDSAPQNPFADDASMAPPPVPTMEMAPMSIDAAPPAVPAASSADMAVYNAMAREMDEFVAEVRRSIDYFRSKGGDVHRVYLSGGGAKLKGLPSFLERVLGIPTEMYDPLRGMQVTGKKIDPSTLGGLHSDYTVAVGNGLHIVFE